MYKTIKTMFPIKHLEKNQVFVFGSNDHGIHGSGSAGYAMHGNNYPISGDAAYERAKVAPPGHPDKAGKWAVYGVGRGYQKGKLGESYAISTIPFPGDLPKTPEEKSKRLRDIYAQIKELISFAQKNPEKEFLITAIGTQRAGFTQEDMALVWETAEDRVGFPDNFTFVKLITSEV